MKQKRKQPSISICTKGKRKSTISHVQNVLNNTQDNSETEEARKDIEYSRRFIKKSKEVAGEGKLVYVTRKHHELIHVIVHSLGEGDMNMFSYIKNVLDEHFEKEKDSIKRLYDANCNRNIL